MRYVVSTRQKHILRYQSTTTIPLRCMAIKWGTSHNRGCHRHIPCIKRIIDTPGRMGRERHTPPPSSAHWRPGSCNLNSPTRTALRAMVPYKNHQQSRHEREIMDESGSVQSNEWSINNGNARGPGWQAASGSASVATGCGKCKAGIK